MQAQQPITPDEARAIAADAYIYAFPIIENYKTMYKQVVDGTAPEYVGGFGIYRHYSQPFTPDNHDIVTPNNDTPYSWAWLDLRAEPWVLSVPDVPDDRYYVVQWIDLFTFNFAYIGVRSTGFKTGNYLFTGPDWSGETPPGITQVFPSETDVILTLTRVALDGAADVPNVKAIQSQLKLTPLSQFMGQSTPAAPPAIDFPMLDVEKTQSHNFIGYLNFLLQFCQPTHPSEVELMRRFVQIGIHPGALFDAASVDPTVLAAIDAGIEDGKATLQTALDQTLSSNGLFGTREFLQNDYLKRAVAANKGLYGNSIEEAWYGGYVADGTKRHTLHFPAGGLPPARFFWSITMYRLPERWLVENPIDRYSIGDRTDGLQYGEDGSLTLYISHDSPGADQATNWLPAPDGPFSVVARVYGPEPAAINGTWKLSPLQAED